MKYSIGIDVGGTKIAYGLFDQSHTLCGKLVEKSLPELPPEHMMDAMCAHIDKLLGQNGAGLSDVSGVGAVFPGHLYFDRGELVTASNLPRWKNVPIRDYMSDKLGVSVLIDNDANGAALAEHRLGAGMGKRDMIYVTISTGIGAGIIINNALYRGTYGLAGEIGHIYMTDSPNICGCGRKGCIEGVGSGTGMKKTAKALIAQGGDGAALIEAAGGFDAIDARAIYAAYQKGDKLAAQALEYYTDWMGKFFYNVYQIFNLDTIVYGGGVTKIGPALMDRIEEKFLELMPQAREYPMHFLPAHFGDEVGIYGAGLLVE